MILDLQNIFKDYQQEKLVVPVLKDVSLQVEEGEYVAIMGPSGSGKTTLMNIIGCLDRPTSGTYQLAGEDVLKCKDKDMSDLRLRSIGFVFQSFQLLSRQSALENVALPLSYAGVKKKERRERATRALERVGLGDRVTFKPTQLSGGQKQRVAIARMLMQGAPVMIFDDSLSAVDAETDAKIRASLKERMGSATVILISHRITTLMQADEILVLEDGKLAQHGTHNDLIRQEGIYKTIYDIQMSSSDRELIGSAT